MGKQYKKVYCVHRLLSCAHNILSGVQHLVTLCAPVTLYCVNKGINNNKKKLWTRSKNLSSYGDGNSSHLGADGDNKKGLSVSLTVFDRNRAELGRSSF